VALALLSLPAGAVAALLWSWVMFQTPSQSAIRYVMYWSSFVFVPAALIGGPYLALSRTLRPPAAAVAVAVWFGLCFAVLAWWFFQSLNQLTF